ncbi:multidrug effflux MFS transporter [Nocardia callitridis]|uniref:Multidrug effflux MFS transporter n=1 Tax=Nocardia callitridis TaxID=648753 RepID=A0ABP9KS82_9NOCA
MLQRRTPDTGTVVEREETAKAAGATHFPVRLIATLSLLAGVAPLSIDMYLPAFPEMAVEFGTGASAIQLTLTAFLIGLASGQLVIGPLSDRYGRRPLLLIGTLTCALFSALCALAPTIELLASARFFQGFAGAAGIVLGRAVISDRAEGPAAAKLFSLLIVINAVAPIVAPLLGGAIVTGVGWRGVFWALAALAIVMFLCVVLGVPESHPRERRTGGGIASTLRNAGVVLRNRRYLGFTLSYVFAFGVMFAYISASPFVLQNVHGLSAGWYSVVFTTNALGLVVASVVNSKLIGRVGGRAILRAGLLALATLSVAMLVNSLVGPVFVITLILLWCTVASLGLVVANATTLALGEARQAAGTASAVLGALQFLLAAAISPLVGIGGDHTALPMAIVMVVSAGFGLVAFVVATGRRGARSE